MYNSAELIQVIEMIQDMAIDGDGGDSMVDDETNMRDALHAIIDQCNSALEKWDDMHKLSERHKKYLSQHCKYCTDVDGMSIHDWRNLKMYGTYETLEQDVNRFLFDQFMDERSKRDVSFSQR